MIISPYNKSTPYDNKRQDSFGKKYGVLKGGETSWGDSDFIIKERTAKPFYFRPWLTPLNPTFRQNIFWDNSFLIWAA